MKDLRELNGKTLREEIFNGFRYNCAGLALGTFDWNYLDSFEDGAYCEDSDPDEVLEDMIAEVERRFPYLIRVPSHYNIPNRYKVIGMRLGDTTYWNEDGERDFHFIVRYRGAWFHKPGHLPIQKMSLQEVDAPLWSDIYDSEPIWFVDMENIINRQEMLWDM